MWICSYKNRWHSKYYNSPFFDKYAILGSKHLNYIKFREAANIIKNKHLTEEGLNRIKELKNSMNKL